MRKFFAFLAGAALVASVSAQAPTRFSYQAILRDGTGTVEANTSATLGIALLQGGPNGPWCTVRITMSPATASAW